MDLKLNHFIESQQLDKTIILELFNLADKLYSGNYEGNELNGKILCTLFYEPSTRTRLSFESAMLKLGGKVISTENAREFSSSVKGESLEDTIRIISSYVDCIILRHFEEGAAKRAAGVSKIPVINAGDGKGQHPTQALLDIYTIYKERGKIDGIKIAMVGDLAHGRTARSLCYLLGKFNNIRVIFVSPDNLRIGEDIKEYLAEKQIIFSEEDNLEKVLPFVDVVYMTRIQKERMLPDEYEMAEGKYLINQKNFNLLNKDARILHPLPHVEEIDLPIEVEQNDIRVAYFRQAHNGLYVRMALLMHIFGD